MVLGVYKYTDMQSQASETSITPIPSVGEQNPSLTLYRVSLGVPRASDPSAGKDPRVRQAGRSALGRKTIPVFAGLARQFPPFPGSSGELHSQARFGMVTKLVDR